jgi:hypothetical protein
MLFDGSEDASRERRRNHRMVKADGEELVRPDRTVAPCAVDAVDEAGSRLVREEPEKGRAAAFRPPCISFRRIFVSEDRREDAHRAERVEPQRLNLDGLAFARHDGPAVDSRVHPRERLARGVPFEELVRVRSNSEARAALVPRDDIREDFEKAVADEGDVAVASTYSLTASKYQSVASTVL